MPASSALLEIRGIAKSFPGVQALVGVDLEVARGEVHALVGENGAGKSTLGRVIAGVTLPDGGAMRLRGAAYAPSGKAEAQRLGVGMAMQESNLIETLTVAENIFLDRMPRRFGLIDRRAMEAAARSHLEAFGLAGIDPRRPVGSLGVGQRQLLEIAGAVARRGCELLILDEPSAALAGREVELLFARVRELRARGAGVIYISHRLEEVRRLADRVTVLRDGRVVATRLASGLGSAELIRLMVGRDAEPPRRQRAAAGEVALRLEGLMGSGRTETVRAIFGADRAEAGRVFLGGSREPARIRSPRDAVRQGLALLTEDRKEQGLLLPMSLRANITLARMRSVSRLGAWIRPRAEASACERFVGALSLRCRSPEQPVRELSGGNQQKALLARWLHRDGEVLIFDEPTRGVDVAAKLEIHRLLLELAARGKAVLVVSSELEELTALCDRIAVLSAGRLVDTFERGAWSQDAILAAALSGYMDDARSQ